MSRKKSKVLESIFGEVNPTTLSEQIAKKLTQFHSRYEAITDTILTPEEREVINTQISDLQTRYQDVCEKYDNEMKDYIEEVLISPPLETKSREFSLA